MPPENLKLDDLAAKQVYEFAFTSVVPGSFRDYSRDHPARAVLIVEIADSSLALDRALKGSLYARARLAGLRRRPDPLDPRRYRNRSAVVPR